MSAGGWLFRVPSLPLHFSLGQSPFYLFYMTYCLSSRKCIYVPSFEHFCVIKRSSPLNSLFWTKCTKSAVDFIINGILGSRNVLSVLCRKTHLLNVFMFKGNKTRCERQALPYTTDPSPISAPFVFQNFPSWSSLACGPAPQSHALVLWPPVMQADLWWDLIDPVWHHRFIITREFCSVSSFTDKGTEVQIC